MRHPLLTTSALLLLWGMAAGADLKPEDVPSFQLRARVLAVGGQEPGEKKLALHLDVPNVSSTAAGKEWSDWMKFGPAQAEAALKNYPNLYLKRFPVVLHLRVDGAADPTVVEAELKLEETGRVVPLRGDLFGPALGILVWRDEAKAPQAATMAEYNRRYWKVLEGIEFTESQRPKKFPIVERFIGGDDDRLAWQEGIERLARAGFSAIMLPPSRPTHEMLLKTGLRRTAWAIYNPPGYAFDYDPKVTPEAIQAWAEKEAKPYLDAGYAREDMAVFAMSDEPGWYYPSMLKPLEECPAGMARFREYLKGQGLAARDVGAKSWDEVRPLGRGGAKDLASKRLFYWTARFFAWDSARHFAVCTRAMEKAFYPGMPMFTNWNFFAGRFYVPGPVANNADKQSPDAGMGGHDWFEFARLRGTTMLWTEDWFSDAMAPQWSFYCAKLRSAAARGGIEFGGYVIPRTAGDRPDGILQKILCLVGSGGKAIKYFVFGPEYNFPGNCYSENVKVLPKMAEAHRMIGAAEDVLWPGRRPRPEVAILAPRSAEAWDLKEMPVARGIDDATNNHLNNSTVDYMAEVFDLYLALQHADIPADFVDEDDLSARGLKPYRVLYVTEPDVPAEGQRGIADWVTGGGTLVLVPGAGSRDRYDESCRVLAEVAGIEEEPRERMLVPNLESLKPAGKGAGASGEFEAAGVRAALRKAPKEVAATFEDGAPAVVQRKHWFGRAIYFAWMPGLSYAKSSKTTKDRLPVDYSESMRRWITWPTELAGVRPPVTADRPMIETPMLVSSAGAAVTVLNWSGEPVEKLSLRVRVPFAVRTVEAVKGGRLAFEPTKDGVTCALPLGAADIVMVRP